MKAAINLLAGGLLWATAAFAAPPCRVAVNLWQDAGPGGAGLQAYDLRIAADIEARRFPGLLVGDADRLARLHVEAHEEVKSRPPAKTTQKWAELRAGEAVWAGGKEEIGLATPDDGAQEWDSTLNLSVVGVFGSYVSVTTSAGGYAGGAHGFDDSNALTLAWGKPVDVSTLVIDAPGTLKAALAAAEAAAKAQGEEPWDGNPPTIDATTWKGALALAMGARGPALLGGVSCCTWAMNHNFFEIDIPARATAALDAHVPDPQGWFRKGQCAVRMQPQGLEVHVGDAARLAVPAVRGRVLGVSWLTASAGESDAVGYRALAKARAAAAAAGKDNEAWMAWLERGMAVAPADGPTLADAAWLGFKLGRLDEAGAYAKQALTLTTEPAPRGAIHYTLGRVAEAKGDRAAASAAYTESLRLRPNKTVQARLEALAP